jgi:hypothetical protein
VSAIDPHQVFHRIIEAVWRIESARVIAGLTRLTRDVGRAEDLAQEAAGVATKNGSTVDFSVTGDERLNEAAQDSAAGPNKRRRTMKYICLGYIEPGKFEEMTEDERHAVLDECFEHNDHLRANGHLVAEVALQPPETALTVYWKNGKVATTDGPYAETKEQLGGIQTLEARDLNHAIQLISQLPGFKYGLGPIEIRPAADLDEMKKESEQQRRKNTTR